MLGADYIAGAGVIKVFHYGRILHVGKAVMNRWVRRYRVGGSFSVVLMAVAALAGLHQSADGAVTKAWVQRYNPVVSNAQDYASAVVRDPAGNIIVAGHTAAPYHDMLLLKYSGADGSLLWQQRYNGPANSDDVLTAAAVDRLGNIAVVGYSDNGDDRDYFTAKYAPDGRLLWAQRYDGPMHADDEPTA